MSTHWLYVSFHSPSLRSSINYPPSALSKTSCLFRSNWEIIIVLLWFPHIDQCFPKLPNGIKNWQLVGKYMFTICWCLTSGPEIDRWFHTELLYSIPDLKVKRRYHKSIVTLFCFNAFEEAMRGEQIVL